LVDDPADVILVGTVRREAWAGDRYGREDPTVSGSLADPVAAIQALAPRSPENRLSLPFWAFLGAVWRNRRP